MIGRNGKLMDMEYSLIRDPVEREAAKKKDEDRRLNYVDTRTPYFTAKTEDAQKYADLLVDIWNDIYSPYEHLRDSEVFMKEIGDV